MVFANSNNNLLSSKDDHEILNEHMSPLESSNDPNNLNSKEGVLPLGVNNINNQMTNKNLSHLRIDDTTLLAESVTPKTGATTLFVSRETPLPNHPTTTYHREIPPHGVLKKSLLRSGICAPPIIDPHAYREHLIQKEKAVTEGVKTWKEKQEKESVKRGNLRKDLDSANEKLKEAGVILDELDLITVEGEQFREAGLTMGAESRDLNGGQLFGLMVGPVPLQTKIGENICLAHKLGKNVMGSNQEAAGSLPPSTLPSTAEFGGPSASGGPAARESAAQSHPLTTEENGNLRGERTSGNKYTATAVGSGESDHDYRYNDNGPNLIRFKARDVNIEGTSSSSRGKTRCESLLGMCDFSPRGYRRQARTSSTVTNNKNTNSNMQDTNYIEGRHANALPSD